MRSNITPDAFETSTPSLYALRFFSSSAANEAVKSRLSKSRVSQQNPDSLKEKTEVQLSPVELTINKKIKYPHDKVRFFRCFCWAICDIEVPRGGAMVTVFVFQNKMFVWFKYLLNRFWNLVVKSCPAGCTTWTSLTIVSN